MKHVLRTPDLDLPQSLISNILNEIDSGIAVASEHDYRSTNDCPTEKLLRYISLGRGVGRVYRVSRSLENRITHHYQALIDRVPIPCKVRVKSFQDVNWVPIHADRSPTSPHGDTATLTVGLRTNGEVTNFYDWRGGEIFESSLWNLLSCRRVDTIRLEPGQSYLFNNEQPHSVTGFRDSQRFLLCLGWPGLEFQELKRIYQEIGHA